MFDATAYVTSQNDEMLPAVVLAVSCIDGEGPFFYETEDGTVEIPDVDTISDLMATPLRPGYWTAHSNDFDDGLDLMCGDLPDPDAPSWWHDGLGQTLDDPERGLNLRIGVVDAGFQLTDGLDHVQIVWGDSFDAATADARRWRHGEAVCRIIGDKSAPPSCGAMAPGADLLFASGSFTHSTRRDENFVVPMADGDIGDYLDPHEVANAVQALIDEKVDIINLSLGSFDKDNPDFSVLGWAIEEARAMGAVVICAAGNRHVEGAAFPACLPACVGIGAFGKTGWGAAGSFCRHLSTLATETGLWGAHRIFLSPEAAYGDGVDMIAPGVGITVSRNGAPAFDLTGTSFAAPIVSGLLAVALDGDAGYSSLEGEARTRYAEQVLSGLCGTAGLARRYQGKGVPAID